MGASWGLESHAAASAARILRDGLFGAVLGSSLLEHGVLVHLISLPMVTPRRLGTGISKPLVGDPLVGALVGDRVQPGRRATARRAPARQIRGFLPAVAQFRFRRMTRTTSLPGLAQRLRSTARRNEIMALRDIASPPSASVPPPASPPFRPHARQTAKLPAILRSFWLNDKTHADRCRTRG